MKSISFSLIVFVSLLASPIQADELLDAARELFEPIPTEPPELEGNPATPEKVELGKMLYFEPRLSESHTISCNSCHIVGLGGVDMLETSIGHRWQQGGRNEAYPDNPEPVTIENTADAIAVFEATLITPDAPFDLYLTGDADALAAEEKEGLQLFIDSGCAACHSGMNLGGDQYQPFGVVEKPGADYLPLDDKGRFDVTQSVDDEYVFKVPTLRNIALTPPYFHTGRSWDLRQAVAVMSSAQLGIYLMPEEIDKITAFLHTLTGEQPEVAYPILPPSVATTPKPRP